MKTIKNFMMLALIVVGGIAQAQEGQSVNNGYWQVGFGLGELPMGGSFKPSITLGYNFNDHIYSGFIYQFKDQIQRDEHSFNAASSELDGLTRSSESVAQRFMFQLRYKPYKQGMYLSTGFVFNGNDQERMVFDNRSRIIADEHYSGSIEIEQSRPAGWGLAVGLGCQYDFNNGFSAGFEWTPVWGKQITPTYSFSGDAELSERVENELETKMNEAFRNSVTNKYKVFHLGVAYRFNQ